MANVFTGVPKNSVPSNIFDLSHDVKLSMNMGQLVPVCVQECVPGDKFHISSEALIRYAPMVAPVMHRINAFTHFYFVPNRLLWNNWEDFITNGGATPGEAGSQPAHPTLTLTPDLYSLADYFGLPVPDASITTPTAITVNALPFVAYNKIYNDYYRDQNLIEPLNDTISDGDHTPISGQYVVQNRAWEHDYFTSALPSAQKGDAVVIPIAGPDGVPISTNYDSGSTLGFKTGDPPTAPAAGALSLAAPSGNFSVLKDSAGNSLTLSANGVITPDDLVDTGGTINDLRRAIALQGWLEKNARGGSRYIENIKSHFGVTSSDARLQRAEYLGGFMQPIVISEVLQTSASDDDNTAQGNMAGHGISHGQSNSVNYFCEEHGWIIGLMSVMPKTAYFQGVNRFWSRRDNTDYYWPSFANLGEQAIRNDELFFDFNQTSTGSHNTGTFGYIPRYSEYKFNSNRVSGDFRTTLDYWHMARKFDPTHAPIPLNGSFVTSDPTERIFAVTDPGVSHLYCHVFHQIKARRPMPVYGVPSIL